MERLTDNLFDWLKVMTTPRLPLQLIEHRCDVYLVDADGNRADADTLYYAKEAANALPLLIAEIERLREQLKEDRLFLEWFLNTGGCERVEVCRRAKALLEKEGVM